MSINAALAVGSIVKRRIKEEMHQREARGQSEAISDAKDMVDADLMPMTRAMTAMTTMMPPNTPLISMMMTMDHPPLKCKHTT
jgi:hypothetical protein